LALVMTVPRGSGLPALAASRALRLVLLMNLRSVLAINNVVKDTGLIVSGEGDFLGHHVFPHEWRDCRRGDKWGNAQEQKLHEPLLVFGGGDN